jgi:hypothetical protein
MVENMSSTSSSGDSCLLFMFSNTRCKDERRHWNNFLEFVFMPVYARVLKR